MCPDNTATRALWLDCGNDYDTGQIVLGSTGDVAEILRKLKISENGVLSALPYASLLFPSLLEPEAEPAAMTAESCAELVQQGSQHLLINDMVANIAAQYVYKLLHRQAIASFMTYVNTASISVRSLPICLEELTPYFGEQCDFQSNVEKAELSKGGKDKRCDVPSPT